VKKAALERVFGFEIMPAPFVVAHLQVGLVLQGLGAGLEAESERAGIYLTNSLTGWEPETRKPLPFPELEEERERAGEVKQDKKILVVIGNPPYNGFAGMAIAEERKLTEAYRTTKKVRKPEGQGLNDLYVRFFRMAERRIAEKTGKGIVSFISNYSWLDGLSFTGMRERFLEAFDEIRIDCLNGDKYKTGKTTPDGKPDPSIFSTEHNREGIQVGTAIATLVRKEKHEPASSVAVRQLWGTAKRRELLETAEASPAKIYGRVTPPLELGLPFIGATMGADYFSWPKLPDLLPVSFPGVKTSRDDFLVAIDREDLETRIAAYFNPKASHEEIKARFPSAMTASGRFDPVATREALLRRERLALPLPLTGRVWEWGESTPFSTS
jgi:predicted helicase